MNKERFLDRLSCILEELSSKEHQKAFIDNMEHLNKDFDSFAEWMMTYLAWSELGSEQDCKAFYWYLEETNEQK